jgi:ribosome-associated protein
MHPGDDYTDAAPQETPRGPSKSQRKREATALQAMGAKLVDLSPHQLDKISLPSELREAIRFAQNLSQRGARKRQLQYIGKLMRQVDSAAIRAALNTLTSSSALAKRQHHYLEALCAALIANDEASLEHFLARHPSADRQHLRQLMRNAAREQQRGKPPHYRRALFRYLRQQIETGP